MLVTPILNKEQVNVAYDQGPVCQARVPDVQLFGAVLTIAGTSSITSEIVTSCGYKNIAFAITSSQVIDISIQRYLDQDATILQGNPFTATTVATVPQVLNINDDKAFESYKITLTNNTGSTANLTSIYCLQQAN